MKRTVHSISCQWLKAPWVPDKEGHPLCLQGNCPFFNIISLALIFVTSLPPLYQFPVSLMYVRTVEYLPLWVFCRFVYGESQQIFHSQRLPCGLFVTSYFQTYHQCINAAEVLSRIKRKTCINSTLYFFFKPNLNNQLFFPNY